MTSAFQDRVVHFSSIAEQEESTLKKLSLFRAMIFIVCAGLIIAYFKNGMDYLLLLASIAGVSFIFLVRTYQRHEKSLIHTKELNILNKEEVLRSELSLSSFDDGSKFQEADHPYQIDLDIVGSHSLFQLINRCGLQDSKKLLAYWLSHRTTKIEIQERQEAVRELSNKLDWMQSLNAKIRIALKRKKKEAPEIKIDDVLLWMHDTSINSKNNGLWIAWILNVITILAIGISALGYYPYQIIYVPIFVNILYLGTIFRKLKKLISGIDKAHYLIKSYSEALLEIEKEPFTSGRLTRLQNHLKKTKSATKAISELSALTQRIDSRNNMLYAFVDILFVTDGHLLHELLNWKRKYAQQSESWLQSVHEMESLSSVGMFAYAHPAYNYPEICNKTTVMTSALGHPLIRTEQVVKNDFSISEPGSVHIITGSNMSGKSTFQRTVGINLVLAYLGAPVFADSMQTGIFQLFTSMRTRDNLEESTSSFYAELKRIKELLSLIEKGETTFFLLDEILKGTNSKDRHTGAVALVKKLSSTTSLGLISTHDIELGILEREINTVSNYSFNSEINGDQITFDYKVTKGICKSFNASQLMKNMGIID